jgi:hypothetical protein
VEESSRCDEISQKVCTRCPGDGWMDGWPQRWKGVSAYECVRGDQNAATLIRLKSADNDGHAAFTVMTMVLSL